MHDLKTDQLILALHITSRKVIWFRQPQALHIDNFSCLPKTVDEQSHLNACAECSHALLWLCSLCRIFPCPYTRVRITGADVSSLRNIIARPLFSTALAQSSRGQWRGRCSVASFSPRLAPVASSSTADNELRPCVASFPWQRLGSATPVQFCVVGSPGQLH